jgi:rubrerythrin
MVVGILTILAGALHGLLSAPLGTDGQCRKCGYDLTGNVSGVCPECGEAVVA